jgi:uncharacterized protein YerC
VMGDEQERLMQAEHDLAEAIAQRDALERVLAVFLDVVTEAQFASIRARLDAADQVPG